MPHTLAPKYIFHVLICYFHNIGPEQVVSEPVLLFEILGETLCCKTFCKKHFQYSALLVDGIWARWQENYSFNVFDMLSSGQEIQQPDMYLTLGRIRLPSTLGQRHRYFQLRLALATEHSLHYR